MGSIKFLAWGIKPKISYAFLTSLKLNTLSLVLWLPDLIYISFFLYFRILCCLDIFVAPLLRTRLFQHLGNIYLIFEMFSLMLGHNRSLEWIQVTCQRWEIPVKKKCIWRSYSFIAFKSDYKYFLKMLVKFWFVPKWFEFIVT